MNKEKEVSKALDGKKKGKESTTHTHGVHYERADNGGMVAHVHKHHGAGPHSEGHSHTENHVIPSAEDAQAHLEEHMGDQPAAGEMEPPQPEPPAPGGGDAAGGGTAPMAGM